MQKEAHDWLASAAMWRFFSLVFRLPSRAQRAELRSMARELPRELRRLAREIQQTPLKTWEMEFHRVLGAGGIPACESSYDDNALAGRGPLLADVRGFYEAFAYQPQEPPAELPDHLAVQLDFMAYLAVKIAFAIHEGRAAQSETALNAYRRFLEQHLHPWVGRLRDRVLATLATPYGIALDTLCNHLNAQAPAMAN